MSFRTVIITSRCKLEYSLNFLVCRGDDEKRINIDEISTLIIQNVGVAITAALLSKLMESKVKVIFCDPRSNPQGELVSYYDNFSTYEKIKEQINWDSEFFRSLWMKIIQEKISNQSRNLSYLHHSDASLLLNYSREVGPGDPSNREGHAAKLYFPDCFGQGFTRDDPKNPINGFLNYGYSILLSAINREIKSFGYLTEFGIHHIGSTNPFNLSCDFMEPLRPLVDFLVLSKKINEDNFKTQSAGLLSQKVKFRGAELYLDNALHLYVQSLLIALKERDLGKADFIAYELT
jgi:CRISPR-associated protein Cas1